MALKRFGSGYRTVLGAVVATAVLLWMVHRGSMPLTRALPSLVFAWMVVLLAGDYRAAAQEHAARVMNEEGPSHGG